jgi:SAM-dependent methyltransferase
MNQPSWQATRDEGAAIFAEDDVVATYHARPPYAPELYETLLRQTPGRARALDVGCGPGKVAGVLADHFAEVVALDPSAPMIAAGRAADAGRHPNIVWATERAEDFDSEAGFDLVTAGSSIHWADPEILFPKLARWTTLFAVLSNDPIFPLPSPPCGHDAWIDFLTEWYARTGRTAPAAWRYPDPDAMPAAPHEAWMDVAGRGRFRFSFRQSVGDFVASCHSRVSWRRAVMGSATADAFDTALAALMRPYATDGMLDLELVSDLTWGAPRAAQRHSP